MCARPVRLGRAPAAGIWRCGRGLLNSVTALRGSAAARSIRPRSPLSPRPRSIMHDPCEGCAERSRSRRRSAAHRAVAWVRRHPPISRLAGARPSRLARKPPKAKAPTAQVRRRRSGLGSPAEAQRSMEVASRPRQMLQAALAMTYRRRFARAQPAVSAARRLAVRPGALGRCSSHSREMRAVPVQGTRSWRSYHGASASAVVPHNRTGICVLQSRKAKQHHGLPRSFFSYLPNFSLGDAEQCNFCFFK